MEENKLKTSKNALEEIKLIKESNIFDKLFIPLKVEKKIRLMCLKISEVEWSGALFYKTSGDYNNNNLVIECVDFFPMDIGDKTYTEFDMSPDVISYMTDNPKLLDCQMGLIHSHNSMATFFSTTDTNTLLSEGKDRNHFVSLIVNNEGTYSAAITRRETDTFVGIKHSKYDTFQDKEVILKDTPFSYKMSKVVWRDLNITKEEPKDPFFKILSTRINDILKRKEESKKLEAKTFRPDFGEYHSDYSTFDEEDTYLGRKKCIKQEDTYIKSPEKPIVDTKVDTNVEEDATDDVIKQLVTGFVAKLPSTFNLEDWVNNKMESTFNKRFKNMKYFSYWADPYLEFIIGDIEIPSDDPYVDTFEEAAIKLRNSLSKLKSNKYIQYYINYITENYGE